MTGRDPAAAPVAYIAPEIGVSAALDAVAAIRAVVALDGQRLHTILTGTDVLPQMAGMLAAVAAVLCRRCGLDDQATAALIGELGNELTDFILSQPRPERDTEEVVPDA